MKRLILLSIIALGVFVSCRNRAVSDIPLVPTSDKENDIMIMTDSAVKAQKNADTLSDGSKRL